MKQRITKGQLEALPVDLQFILASWFETTIEDDSTFVRVYIPEEKRGPTGGIFFTWWGEEQFDGKDNDFIYPEPYVGKLRSHRGVVLPLMDVGQMIAFIAQYNPGHLGQRMSVLCSSQMTEGVLYTRFEHEQLADFLWNGCKVILEQLLVQENLQKFTA